MIVNYVTIELNLLEGSATARRTRGSGKTGIWSSEPSSSDDRSVNIGWVALPILFGLIKKKNENILKIIIQPKLMENRDTWIGYFSHTHPFYLFQVTYSTYPMQNICNIKRLIILSGKKNFLPFQYMRNYVNLKRFWSEKHEVGVHAIRSGFPERSSALAPFGSTLPDLFYSIFQSPANFTWKINCINLYKINPSHLRKINILENFCKFVFFIFYYKKLME